MPGHRQQLNILSHNASPLIAFYKELTDNYHYLLAISLLFILVWIHLPRFDGCLFMTHGISLFFEVTHVLKHLLLVLAPSEKTVVCMCFLKHIRNYDIYWLFVQLLESNYLGLMCRFFDCEHIP